MVASDGGLSEGYGHEGPGVCQTEAFLKDTGMAGLGDGQTEAEVVPSQSGCGDALLRRMPLYLTYLPDQIRVGTTIKWLSGFERQTTIFWVSWWKNR